jgi:hypothetical protein
MRQLLPLLLQKPWRFSPLARGMRDADCWKDNAAPMLASSSVRQPEAYRADAPQMRPCANHAALINKTLERRSE